MVHERLWGSRRGAAPHPLFIAVHLCRIPHPYLFPLRPEACAPPASIFHTTIIVRRRRVTRFFQHDGCCLLATDPLRLRTELTWNGGGDASQAMGWLSGMHRQPALASPTGTSIMSVEWRDAAAVVVETNISLPSLEAAPTNTSSY